MLAGGVSWLCILLNAIWNLQRWNNGSKTASLFNYENSSNRLSPTDWSCKTSLKRNPWRSSSISSILIIHRNHSAGHHSGLMATTLTSSLPCIASALDPLKASSKRKRPSPREPSAVVTVPTFLLDDASTTIDPGATFCSSSGGEKRNEDYSKQT